MSWCCPLLSMSGQLNALGQVAGGPFIGLIGTLRGLRMALVVVGIALAPALPLVALAHRQGAQPDPSLAVAGEAVADEAAPLAE